MNFHDYKALQARLNDTDIYTLIADCDTIFAENPTEFIRLLRSALSLSAHVLEADKSALAHQLAGRLYHHVDKNADIKAFVDGITPPKNSLYPIDNGYDPLVPAGGMLVNTMKWNHTVYFIQLRDGQILSWSRDKTLYLWDVTGKSLAVFEGHTDSVYNAIELDNGNILSWSWDNTLRLWDSTGKSLAVFEGHTDGVYNAIELDNGRILSWSWDDTLCLWSKDGHLLAKITEPVDLSIGNADTEKGGIKLLNGRFLSWGLDNNLRLWDSDGKLVTILKGHAYWVFGAINVAGERILSWSRHIFGSEGSYAEIRLWNKDGLLIDMIDEDYYVGNRDIIATWIEKHDLNADDVFPAKDLSIPIMGGFLQEDDANLIVYNRQKNANITTFYGEYLFTSIAVVDDVVIAGDVSGRVIFLRWVE